MPWVRCCPGEHRASAIGFGSRSVGGSLTRAGSGEGWGWWPARRTLKVEREVWKWRQQMLTVSEYFGSEGEWRSGGGSCFFEGWKRVGSGACERELIL